MNKEKLMSDLLILCEWIMNCSLSNLIWVIFVFPSFFTGYQLLFANFGAGVLMNMILFSLFFCALTLPITHGLLHFCKDWRERRLSKFTFYLKKGYQFWLKEWTSALIFTLLFSNFLLYFRVVNYSALLMPIMFAIGIVSSLTLLFYITLNLYEQTNILTAAARVIVQWKNALKIFIVVFFVLFLCLFGVQYLYIIGVFSVLGRFAVRTIDSFL